MICFFQDMGKEGLVFFRAKMDRLSALRHWPECGKKGDNICNYTSLKLTLQANYLSNLF